MSLDIYQKTEQYASDLLLMLDSSFSLVPMRATGIRGYELDDERKQLLEYATGKMLDYRRPTLIAGIRAEKFFKGPLEPYRDRALAVTYALEELARKNSFAVRTLGYVPDANEEKESWPGLLMTVFHLNSSGALDMRVVPTLGLENGSPIMPASKLRENGLIFTGRPENIRKWTECGFFAEQTPSEFQI